MAQGYDQRVVICRFDANGGWVREFAFGKCLSVVDVEKDVGVLGGGLGMEQSLPRIFEILGPDFLAVAPWDVVAKVKDDFSAAFLNVPGLGYDRSRPQVLIELGQTNHQIRNHVERDMVGRDRPVKTGRFSTEIDSEMSVAVTLGSGPAAAEQGDEPDRNDR